MTQVSSFFLVNIDYDVKPMEFFTQGLWGELQQTMSSTPLIGHMTDSLDTGQTEDDAFNPKPIDPELNNSEQFKWRVHPALSLLGMSTTMASDSGVSCHPCTSHDIAHVQVNSKAVTRDLWSCQKDH